jgi:class 3 adenylate cyclase
MTELDRQLDGYRRAVAEFRWDVPDGFNFSRDVVDRYAAESDRPALLWCDPGGARKRVGFGEISARSHQFAHLLRALGVAPGEPLIVMLPRVPEWHVVNVGALAAGLLVIPSSTLLRPKDIAYRAGHSGAGPSEAQRLLRRRDEEENDRVRRAYRDLAVPTLLIRRPGAVQLTPRSPLQIVDSSFSVTRRVEVPGTDSLIFGTELDAVLAEISDFLTGETRLPPVERSLQAVLFTDLGGSTELAGELGDRRWRTVIDWHDEISERLVVRHGGRLVKTTGDGVLALLPSATAALHAAMAIREALAGRDLQVRAGVHVGDLEERGDDVAGLTVNIAARVMGEAEPGEILATVTAVQAALGADLEFSPHSHQELKGLPGEWELLRLSR